MTRALLAALARPRAARRRAGVAAAAARLAARRRGRGDVRRVRHRAERLERRRWPTRSARSSAQQIAAGHDQGADQGGARGASTARRARRARATAASTSPPGSCRSRWRSALAARRRAAPAAGAAPAPPGRRAGAEPDGGGPALDPADARRLDAELAALRPVIAAGGVDTTVVAAFAVGFVSFISPCVLPLVPGYLSAVSGVERRRAAARASARRRRCCCPAIVFCLSFTVVFVALGHDRHRPRLDAAGPPRHARQGRRARDHRARRASSCSRRSCPSSTASGGRTR